MQNIENTLRQRKKVLDQLIRNKKRELNAAPKGRLVIDASGKSRQYYMANEGRRQYLPVGQMELIRALAQKGYDGKVLEKALKESKVIERFLSEYPEIKAEDLFENMRAERRGLVVPIAETREERVRRWREESFETNPIPVGDTGLVTERGEVVRSRAEYMIANELKRSSAEYHYEKLLYLDGWGDVYPDFTVLNVRTGKMYFWEHLGMTNDPEYVQKNIRKIEAYMRNGYYPGESLILSSETMDFRTGEIRIDMELIRQIIRKYCI